MWRSSVERITFLLPVQQRKQEIKTCVWKSRRRGAFSGEALCYEGGTFEIILGLQSKVLTWLSCCLWEIRQEIRAGSSPVQEQQMIRGYATETS